MPFDDESENPNKELDPADINGTENCDQSNVTEISIELMFEESGYISLYHLSQTPEFEISCALKYINLSKSEISNYMISKIFCTWFLEAHLFGNPGFSQKHINYSANLLNSILTSWCTGENKNVALFVSQRSFIAELISISRRLQTITLRPSRTLRLHSELASIDRALTHPVFIPMLEYPDHVVVRIPYSDSSVLNSKYKAPYLLYLEVIEKNNTNNSEIDAISCNDEDTYLERLIKLKIYAMSKKGGRWINYPKKTTYGSETAIEMKSGKHKRSCSTFDSDGSSISILNESWKNKVERIKQSSPFGNIDGWKLYSVVVKYGDDLRQDYLAYQFLKKCQQIWKIENVGCWVRPYFVVITDSQGGIIEAVTDAVSIHQIKSLTGSTLENYFRAEYHYNSEEYSAAKKEFIRSLAGYSLFQYIFQVKDRHNDNILMDMEGHIIHIDFGFILGQSPKNISFETSPFKMSYDFLELLDGSNSDFFLYFKSLMYFGLLALRKHMDKLMILVDIMKMGDTLPCLGKNGQAIDALRGRFHTDLDENQLMAHVDKLVYQSCTSLTTFIYDKFQYYTNGIRT